MIKGKSKFHWMGVSEWCLGKAWCLFICTLSLLGSRVFVLLASKLSNIPVIVSLHFVKENFALISGAVRHEMLVKQVKDILTNAFQFFLDHSFIVFDFLDVFLVSLWIFFLLDRCEHSPCCSSRSHYILECYREDVPLFQSQLLTASLCELCRIGTHL